MSLDRVPPIPLSRAHVCGRNVCINLTIFQSFFIRQRFPWFAMSFCTVLKHLNFQKNPLFWRGKTKIFSGTSPRPPPPLLQTPHQDPDQLRHCNMYNSLIEVHSRDGRRPMSAVVFACFRRTNDYLLMTSPFFVRLFEWMYLFDCFVNALKTTHLLNFQTTCISCIVLYCIVFVFV